MAKISFSTIDLQKAYGDKKALLMAKRAGFDGVDLSVINYGEGVLPDVFGMPHEEFVAYFKDLRDYAASIDITIVQTHSLVDSYHPNDPETNQALHLRALRGLEATAILGCSYCVMHCISTFQWGYGVPDEVMHRENQAMYAALIETAERLGVMITLESFGGVTVQGVKGYDHFADPEKMLREYEALPTKNKAFCLDSGHTHVASGGGYRTVPEYIRLFGDRIRVLHLHDNSGTADQHLIPGQGSIRWKAVFDALQEIGYDGYYNYEVTLAPFPHALEEATVLLGKHLRSFTEEMLK